MLSQLKNNLNSKNLFFTGKEKSLMNFEPILLSKHPYKKQSRHINPSTPTRISSLSIKNNHKKHLNSSSFTTSNPNSTNKSILQPPSRRQSQTSQPQQSKPLILHQQDVIRMLSQSQKYITQGCLIQGMNLLKAMRQSSITIENKKLSIIIVWNLGAAYYQAGFLEEAHDEFTQAIGMLKGKSFQQQSQYSKIHRKLLLAKLQLQICILFSQLGSHNDALQHARRSSKLNYEMVYQLISTLCKHCMTNFSRLSITQSEHNNDELPISELNLCNNIMAMEYLHKLVGDLGGLFGVERKVGQVRKVLAEWRVMVVGWLDKNNCKRVDMEMLYGNISNSNNNQLQWIYTSKILDRIQLKPLSPDHFSNEPTNHLSLLSHSNHAVIQSITYLAISFYCYSTQVRFVQKAAQQQQQRVGNYEQGDDDIRQSQHWLSRSLEIAYSFLPSNAPILNQILTVHDRFHSLDKQTIHQDRQVCGYFKVLKSLSKPKSLYSSSTTVGQSCSPPIMIRVQAPILRKFKDRDNSTSLFRIEDDLNEQEEQQQQDNNKRLSSQQSKQSAIHPTTIDICSFTKNNKIKGLTTRIKILEFSNDTAKTTQQKHSHHNKPTFHLNNHNHHNHNQTQKRKSSHSTIISDLFTIQNDDEKRERIAKIYQSKNRSVLNKRGQMIKLGKSKQAPKSAREVLDGGAVISEDLLFRPHSFDSKNLTTTKANLSSNRSQSFNPHSIKKRRSLSQNTRVHHHNNKQKLQKIASSNNGNVRLEGLKLTGKRLNENNDQSGGGNIFINNNINLFISSKQIPNTTRQSLSTTTANPYMMGKRLKFMTQRRFHLINTQDNEPSQL